MFFAESSPAYNAAATQRLQHSLESFLEESFMGHVEGSARPKEEDENMVELRVEYDTEDGKKFEGLVVYSAKHVESEGQLPGFGASF